MSYADDAAAAFFGCQPADEGMDGTTVTEPSGADRPMRDTTTNGASGALGTDTNEANSIQTNNVGGTSGGTATQPATP